MKFSYPVCKIFSSVLALFFVSLPMSVFAEVEKIGQPASIQAFSLMNMLNMFMGLVVVIALILGLAWVLKKYGRLPSNNQVEMRVIGGLSLGTREKAILIEVDNRRLLVGVTPGHIQTLCFLDADNSQPLTSFDETLNNQLEKTSE